MCLRIFLAVFCLSLLGSYPAHADSTYDGIPESIVVILRLPENKIDIGIAALTFAKEVYPDLDIKKYSAKINSIAKEAKAFAEENAGGKNKISDPEYKKLVLNTYLYREYKLQYDLSDPYAQKPQNRFIKGILDTKKGSCVTMPMLYIAVAQRMGYPVYPVNTPDHNFLRYVDARLKKQNIEATSNGGYSPDGVLIKDLEVSEAGVKSGAYMKTLTYRQYLAELLSHNGAYWAQQGYFQKAIEYLEKATELYPNGANTYELLARVNYEAGKQSDPLSAEMYLMDAKLNLEKALSLGFVRTNQDKYEDHVNKKLTNEHRKKKEAQ